MVFVQYILLRRDISTVLNWPLGAIVAQGCHAATAAITSYFTHPDTVYYLKEINRMHKIVLGVDNEEQLKNIAQKLKDANIDYYLWTEQPENVCTALATRPYEKSMIQSHFKGLKLLS
ncbi:peptidyl-tRNA hydrolase PTRHD1 [Schistosoma japonicum]|nr:peptidyl-tRNA hydrolase PTRHD1 [Schistosoma japonicum]